MAVGLTSPQNLLPIAGVRIGIVDSGIRKKEGPDLAVLEVSSASTIAAVFTNSKARAAPVEVAIQRLAEDKVRNNGARRALVMNSGNANAGLGQRGIRDCERVCDLVANCLGIDSQFVLPFSTGVIGEALPVSRFERYIESCIDTRSENQWLQAAQAIMTTDTIPKAVSKCIELDSERRITITGIAKGSGMIQPNMATMLAFVATDAVVEAEHLDESLRNAVDISFNSISVDGDTSTNDACVLIATGSSGVQIENRASNEFNSLFQEALQDVMSHLAQAIVRDGEGATKFVIIQVSGANSNRDCRKVGMTIANSPLVKTALHAADPNWGRIYAAIGRSGIKFLDMTKVSIYIGEIEVVRNGERSPNYSEPAASELMKNSELFIRVDLGQNSLISATVWTTDLSYEYIRINAEYRS